MIKRLYEAITGTPWTTGRTASADYGPPPAAVYADQWAHLTDAELLSMSPAEAIAYAHAQRDRNAAAAPTPQRIPARL